MSQAGIAPPSLAVANLQQAFKIALSMVLLFWLALSLNWDMPKYGALAIALISLDTTGASLQKGLLRLLGTTVGLVVGLLGLAMFAQDGLFHLLYHASYLIIVGYFMQSSRYPYAWFVAGFLPLLVWATTFGEINNAFHYAVFRYLETTAGVVIFTLVSMIFWPRQAGDDLNRQGFVFWRDLQTLFHLYREQLSDGTSSSDTSVLRAKIAGNLSRMLTTCQAAYVDTPAIAAKKRVWESFRINSRAFCDALELWRQSIGDVRHLGFDRLLPHEQDAWKKIAERLQRTDQLWQDRALGEMSDHNDDDTLLEPLRLELTDAKIDELSVLDRAALLCFLQQLKILDLTSRGLLRTMRDLAGLAPLRACDRTALPVDFYRPPIWDRARFVHGLVPAVSFAIAYFFWIFVHPPTGPSVPNMAATFGLLVVLTPMNVLVLLPVVLLAIWGFVAPAYFFVMPQLSTGPELLAFIFAFVFSVGALLTGKMSAMKSAVLSVFAMMTGISNQQQYSFIGLVDAALMMTLAISIIAVVQALFRPARPERIVLTNVRNFFRGCERFAKELLPGRANHHAETARHQKHYLESMILPAISKTRATQQHLEFTRYPDNTPEKVQHLLGSMDSISYRLEALKISQYRLAAHDSPLPESFAPIGQQVGQFLTDAFHRSAAFDAEERTDEMEVELQTLSRDLEQRLASLTENSETNQIDHSLLADVYAVAGNIRGLFDAVVDTRVVLRQINWSAWSVVRF